MIFLSVPVTAGGSAIFYGGASADRCCKVDGRWLFAAITTRSPAMSPYGTRGHTRNRPLPRWASAPAATGALVAQDPGW